MNEIQDQEFKEFAELIESSKQSNPSTRIWIPMPGNDFGPRQGVFANSIQEAEQYINLFKEMGKQLQKLQSIDPPPRISIPIYSYMRK